MEVELATVATAAYKLVTYNPINRQDRLKRH